MPAVCLRALRVMHSGDAFAGKNHADHRRATTAAAPSATAETITRRRHRASRTSDTHHHRSQPEDDDGGPERTYAAFNAELRQVGAGRGSRRAKTVDAAARRIRAPGTVQGYAVSTFLGGIKNNIQVAYNELGKKTDNDARG